MDISTQSGPRTLRHEQGRWGSACSVCSSAKVRCVRNDDTPGAPCDRCQRLGKQCAGQVHLPRKKRTTKPRSNKTSQLEERLNGLVELIRGSTELPLPEETDKQTRSHPPEPPTTTTAAVSSSARSHPVIHVPSSWNSSCPPRCICAATHGDVSVSPGSEEDYFAYYQMRLCPQFPFVVLPPGTKAEQCKAERPLLFAAMTMAASVYNPNSMRAQMYQLVAQISEQLLISSNKSMDALQALLVALGWFHNHCVMHAQLSSLLHLAQALLADLGLTREPAVLERTSVMVLMPAQPPPRNKEHRRAVLGVWFLTSFAYTTLQRVMPMRFSKYIKTCLRELEAAPEVGSDQLLVQLVKVQRLAEQTHDHVSQEDEDDLPSVIPRPPFSAYQSAFSAEIQRLKQSLPSFLKENKILRVHLASATLRVYQPPPIEHDVLQNLVSSFDDIGNGGLATIEIFYNARAALTGFFDAFLSLPDEFHNVMPIYTVVHILWGITMLARWARIMGPGRAHPKHANDILTQHKVIWDPSAQKSQSSNTSDARLVPQASHQQSHVCALNRAASPSNLMPASGNDPLDNMISRLRHLPPSITHPTQISASYIREAADPNIPRVIAALKAKLQSQRGLTLDIVDIMTKLGQRFEEVHKLRESRFFDGWQNDIWYICSKKILIARAKLERFAEIISSPSASEQQAQGDPRRGCDAETDDATFAAGASDGHCSMQGQSTSAPADFQADTEANAEGAFPLGLLEDTSLFDELLMGSAFDLLDPSLWLTNDTDWSAPLSPASNQRTNADSA